MDCAFGHLTLGGLIDHGSHRVTETQCVASQDSGPRLLESGAMALRPSFLGREQEPAALAGAPAKATVTVRRRARAIVIP